MLHAVRDMVTVDSGGFPVAQPGAGEERWGYVPQQLLPKLKNMRHAHDYGVDGSVAVADVCGNGFSASPCTVKDGWRTLLVGALGKGGGGLYALDITDPADPQPKWEVSAPVSMVPSRTYSPRLGETWGAPVIARTQLPASRPWSVFVGGGVVPGIDLIQPWGNLFYVLDARTGQVLTDGANSAAFQILGRPRRSGAERRRHPSHPLPARGRRRGAQGLLRRHRGEGLADGPEQHRHDHLEALERRPGSVLRSCEHQPGLLSQRERRPHAHPGRDQRCPGGERRSAHPPDPDGAPPEDLQSADARPGHDGVSERLPGHGRLGQPRPARSLRLPLRPRGHGQQPAPRRCSCCASIPGRRSCPSRHS